jgi:hypothetical protein
MHVTMQGILGFSHYQSKAPKRPTFGTPHACEDSVTFSPAHNYRHQVDKTVFSSQTSILPLTSSEQTFFLWTFSLSLPSSSSFLNGRCVLTVAVENSSPLQRNAELCRFGAVNGLNLCGKPPVQGHGGGFA